MAGERRRVRQSSTQQFDTSASFTRLPDLSHACDSQGCCARRPLIPAFRDCRSCREQRGRKTNENGKCSRWGRAGRRAGVPKAFRARSRSARPSTGEPARTRPQRSGTSTCRRSKLTDLRRLSAESLLDLSAETHGSLRLRILQSSDPRRGGARRPDNWIAVNSTIAARHHRWSVQIMRASSL